MTDTLCHPLDRLFVEQRFLEMLPSIRSVAVYAFRHVPRAMRDELVAEVVANVFCAFHRLVERGQAELAFPTALTWFAVKQVYGKVDELALSAMPAMCCRFTANDGMDSRRNSSQEGVTEAIGRKSSSKTNDQRPPTSPHVAWIFELGSAS